MYAHLRHGLFLPSVPYLSRAGSVCFFLALAASLVCGQSLSNTPTQETVYVSNFDGRQILKVIDSSSTQGTAPVTVLYTDATQGTTFESLVLGSDSAIYAADTGAKRIVQVNLTNPSSATSISLPNGDPEGLSFSSKQELYSNTKDGQGIWRLTFGTTNSYPFSNPTSVQAFGSFTTFGEGTAFGPGDNFYAVDRDNGKVWEAVNGSLQDLGLSGLNEPVGLTFDSVGNLYVANSGAGIISEFPLTNGTYTTATTYATFNSPDAPFFMQFDLSGRLFVITLQNDLNGGKLWRIDGPSSSPVLIVDFNPLVTAKSINSDETVGLALAPTTNTQQELLSGTTPNEFNHGSTLFHQEADYTQAAGGGTLLLPNGTPCNAACLNASGITMQSVLTEESKADYATLVAGTSAAGTTCPAHEGLNGNCAIYTNTCSTTPSDPTSFAGNKCPFSTTNNIYFADVFFTQDSFQNPGFYTGPDDALTNPNDRNFLNILVCADATSNTCSPTVIGQNVRRSNPPGTPASATGRPSFEIADSLLNRPVLRIAETSKPPVQMQAAIFLPGDPITKGGTTGTNSVFFSSTNPSPSSSSTPPTTSYSISPLPTSSGWNNSPAVVTLSATPGGAYPVQSIVYESDGAQIVKGVGGSPVQVTISAQGTTVLQFAAADTNHDSEIAKDAVVKLDLTPPSATINTPQTTVYMQGQVVNANYSCSDLLSGIASCSGPVANGSAIDTTGSAAKTFTVTATDNAGNTSSASVTYQVNYNWNGFFQPVDNPPMENVAKAGSAIPVKFSLTGYQGMNIFAAGYPMSGQITCSTTAPLDAIEQTVTAGNSSLSYDSTADQYNYVWKTSSPWSGTCRQLTLKLADGTTHVAYFKFK